MGNMGLPMSLNLAKHSHNVIAYDNHPNGQAIKIAEKAGIHRANSVEEIGATADCSIIFTMLPGCEAVDHVTSALLESIPSSKSKKNDSKDTDGASPVVLVDCSTVRIVDTRVGCGIILSNRVLLGTFY